MRFILLAAFLGIILAALAGCASSAETAASPGTEVLTIRVVNRNWADMRVYLERDGLRDFLGMVTTGTTASFSAPPDMTAAAGSLRLIGDPVGSRLVFASEWFVAEPGRTVEWTIRVRPAYSSLVVH
jgi:hypothetical protein